MAYFTNTEKNAFFREFRNIAFCQTGRNVKIIEASHTDLGYSTPDFTIALSLTHSFYDSMSKHERAMYLRGIFSHELLHLLITNFPVYMGAIEKKKSRLEKNIFQTLLNIAEDGAIEFFAPDYLSREFTRTLEFVRAKTYDYSPVSKKTDPPVQQFIAALLEFRFFGFLKSTIYDSTAKSLLPKCLEIFAKCFEEPRQNSRVEYVEQCFEISRPLWDSAEAENQEEDIKDLLDSLMKKYFSSENQGSGSGSDSSNPDAGKDSGVSKRRRITIKRVSKEEYEDAVKNSQEGSSAPSGDDITLLVPDEPVDSKSSDSSKDGIVGPGNSSEENGYEKESEGLMSGNDSLEKKSSDSSAGDSKESGDGESSQSTSSTDSANDSTQAKSSSSDSQNSSSFNGESEDFIRAPEVTKDLNEFESDVQTMEDDIRKELDLTSEDIAAINETHEQYKQYEEQESKGSDSEDETVFNLPVGGGLNDVCKIARCQNIVVKCPSDNTTTSIYNAIVAKMSTQISGLANQIRRILQNRQEEQLYKTDGKVCMKRLYGSRVTSRVFTKRRLPESSDFVVAVAIDISGSMNGSKIAVAREAAIALAETMGILKVPVYMFGFTADMNGYHANHFHYINWSNKPKERLRLLSIAAQQNNFDGYSIRYATELLKRKDADKKLLLVISDGNPAAYAYRYGSAMQDVQLAITESNRTATTVGILLGDINGDYHRQMYGYNFIHCKNINDLFPELARILKRFI